MGHEDRGHNPNELVEPADTAVQGRARRADAATARRTTRSRKESAHRRVAGKRQVSAGPDATRPAFTGDRSEQAYRPSGPGTIVRTRSCGSGVGPTQPVPG